MAKLIVYLGDQERDALQEIAQREMRVPRPGSLDHPTGVDPAEHVAQPGKLSGGRATGRTTNRGTTMMRTLTFETKTNKRPVAGGVAACAFFIATEQFSIRHRLEMRRGGKHG
jgi:hypothetical protein